MTEEISQDPEPAHLAVPPNVSTMNTLNEREGQRRCRQQFASVKHGARQSAEQYIDRLVELTRHHTLLPAEFLDKRWRFVAASSLSLSLSLSLFHFPQTDSCRDKGGTSLSIQNLLFQRA